MPTQRSMLTKIDRLLIHARSVAIQLAGSSHSTSKWYPHHGNKICTPCWKSHIGKSILDLRTVRWSTLVLVVDKTWLSHSLLGVVSPSAQVLGRVLGAVSRGPKARILSFYEGDCLTLFLSASSCSVNRRRSVPPDVPVPFCCRDSSSCDR